MTLGDRIKKYESIPQKRFTPNTPVMIRVDGKAFHTFTKGFNKPFDQNLMHAMKIAALRTSEQIQGFKAAYVQSDEATFVLTDYDKITSEGWFDYKIQKIVSTSAALMSTFFFKEIMSEMKTINNTLPTFDSRAFNIPITEVSNAFLWRAKDWHRNSVQMFAQSLFSHKELQNKSLYQIHDMLHNIDRSWEDDLTYEQKNGTFFYNNDLGLATRYDINPNYREINEIISPLVQVPDYARTS